MWQSYVTRVFVHMWTSSYLCLYAAGCCCSGWAAWGLWTAGTAWAWDGGCCSWTDPSSRCQKAGWMGRYSKLQKDRRHEKTLVGALQSCQAWKIKFNRCTVRDSGSQKPEWYSPEPSDGLEIQSVCIRAGFQDVVWVVCNFEPSQVWRHVSQYLTTVQGKECFHSVQCLTCTFVELMEKAEIPTYSHVHNTSFSQSLKVPHWSRLHRRRTISPKIVRNLLLLKATF